MRRWAGNLFILSLVMAAFGFGRMSSFLARLLYVVLSILSVVAVVSHTVGRGLAFLIPRRPLGAKAPRESMTPRLPARAIAA